MRDGLNIIDNSLFHLILFPLILTNLNNKILLYFILYDSIQSHYIIQLISLLFFTQPSHYIDSNKLTSFNLTYRTNCTLLHVFVNFLSFDHFILNLFISPPF